ncbi:hypothetical protein EUX98_g6512 [Antrodiella citrinella]|uniref:Uncharacterized protein n=1 Tax=Antrodiella citrinella TaxID=2447956 RepID=A0A4S4MRC8_9APHY|nr:hypothetical protein EUX98_g6512 [Antrodiella citrinella]
MPTLDLVYEASREAAANFADLGLTSCLCGGTGCALFGVDRTPNVSVVSSIRRQRGELLTLRQDVDLVVLTRSYDTEQLKHMLSARSTKFVLRPSRKRGATYKLLYYQSVLFGSCKVDILIPGILHIPDIPPTRVVRTNELPVMPFMPLLLLKLQAWEHHRESVRWDYQDKQWVDIADIGKLLRIAQSRGEHKSLVNWLSTDFIKMAEARVRRFVRAVPTYSATPSADLWQRVGFEVRTLH